jgi:hypothetical protein
MRIDEMINTYEILVSKPKGKKTLWRSRRILQGNIKTGLREMGLESVDWIHLAQDKDQ